MSQELVNLNPDLKKLQDEEYEIEIRNGYLIVYHVPYVNASKEVKFGVMACQLNLSNDKTMPNVVHTMYFQGEQPCNENGERIGAIYNPTTTTPLFNGFVADRMFSGKPSSGYYDNYYHKVVTYVDILSGPALVLDPGVTAKTGRIRVSGEEESVFNYVDTNSTRANILLATEKLKGYKIALVGVGGTGSYILDFLAKTPVHEIHLFDDDIFLQHNAFRSPGAPSFEELGMFLKKVNYLSDIYLRMRKNIFPHEFSMSVERFSELLGMSFVFISIDKGKIKKDLIAFLIENDIPFVDVGMGIELVDEKLLGIVRTTSFTSGNSRHIHETITFSDDEDQEYKSNIQIAELNALNAALAVIKWKKNLGFYLDTENEHNTLFSVSNSQLINEDFART